MRKDFVGREIEAVPVPPKKKGKTLQNRYSSFALRSESKKKKKIRSTRVPDYREELSRFVKCVRTPRSGCPANKQNRTTVAARFQRRARVPVSRHVLQCRR